LRPFFAQRLRSRRIIPNAGVFEFAQDFDETFLAVDVVKDTP
jgi:hypothetical protein